MIGIMLLGAWFLVHQHCCVADIRTASRTNLVDHLMRRSPLEKNFMRYGRSSPPPSFLPSSVWQMDEKLDKPEKKSKTGRDIMRFGRSMRAPLEGTKGNDGYKHLYPLLPMSSFRIDNPESPGSRTENEEETFRNGLHVKCFEHFLSQGPRIFLNKKNFIRFGRNFKHPTCWDNEFEKVNQNSQKPGQSSKLNNGKMSEDTFEEENDIVDRGNVKEEDPKCKGTWHGKFEYKTGNTGKKLDHTYKDVASNTAPMMNSGYAKDDGKSVHIPATEDVVRSRSVGIRFGGLVPPLALDATSFIAPEFLLLPHIAHQRDHDKRANNFIRLG